VTNIVVDSANNRVTGATDSARRAWSFGYTGNDLTSVTDPASKLTTLGYTGGVLTSVTRSRSRVSRARDHHLDHRLHVRQGDGGDRPISATVANTFTYNAGSTDVGILRDDSPVVRSRRSTRTTIGGA
jgi:YD repeat-containing protein